jgi:hypothetical protein
LNEPFVAGTPFNFGHGCYGIILTYRDRSPEPRLRLAPRFDLPIINCRSERRPKLEILLPKCKWACDYHDAQIYSQGIQVLLSHEIEI